MKTVAQQKAERREMAAKLAKMTQEERNAHAAAYKASGAMNVIERQMTDKEVANMELRNSEVSFNSYGDMTIDEINRFNANKNLKS